MFHCIITFQFFEKQLRQSHTHTHIHITEERNRTIAVCVCVCVCVCVFQTELKRHNRKCNTVTGYQQSRGRNSSITVVCELQELPPSVHVQKNCPSGLLFITSLLVHCEESCFPPPPTQERTQRQLKCDYFINRFK